MQTQAYKKEWLSRREVSDEYGIGFDTLAKWAMSGRFLKFSKFGKFVKYNRADIEEFLASNMTKVSR